MLRGFRQHVQTLHSPAAIGPIIAINSCSSCLPAHSNANRPRAQHGHALPAFCLLPTFTKMHSQACYTSDVRGNSTAVKTPACGVTGQTFESHLRQSKKNPICPETFSKFLNGRRWGYFQETILSTIYDGEEDTFKKRSYQESASDSPVSLKFDDIWRYRNWNWNWNWNWKLLRDATARLRRFGKHSLGAVLGKHEKYLSRLLLSLNDNCKI